MDSFLLKAGLIFAFIIGVFYVVSLASLKSGDDIVNEKEKVKMRKKKD